MKAAKPKPAGSDDSAREVKITRLIHAPRELVWEAYTDAKHIGQWWGPKGFSITTQEIAIKPGGTWRFIMHGPDGTNYPNLIVYTELRKPEYIALEHGGATLDEPGHFSSVITMDAKGANTLLTLRAIFATAAERDEVVKRSNAIEGGNQTIDRLEAHLAEMARRG
ncbi:MAG TPA: SRPBCC family protein [Planctomycetota bacterium]|nr:SRPBCC family protein [Planctomycetota bacterium]